MSPTLQPNRPPNPFADEAEGEATVRRPLPGAPQPANFAPVFPIPSAAGPGEKPYGFSGSDDPFGLVSERSEADPFGFSPRPAFGFEGSGGLPGAEPFQPSAYRMAADSPVEQAFELAALNPLIGVASPLLWLAARLNESDPVEDVGLFRSRVMEEIGRFETSAMARGVPQRLARVARYALCATIDDIVLNTTWGGRTDWAARGLVSSFYQETWGGERFFDLLGQLYLQPEETIDALELMAVCLSIGFVGKYRVVEGGGSHLARLRADLYRTIRRVRGPREEALSAAFAPVAAPYKAPARMIWFWIVSTGALLALLLLYLVLGWMLSARVDAAADKIAALTPAIPVLVDAPDVPAVPEPFVTAPETQLERISGFLPQDIADRTVEVVRDGDIVAVRLLRASFPTGGAALSESEAPLVQRIADALNPEPGRITVVGHTDNVPIANSSPTRNNETLSRDRAASAAAMLQRFLTDPSRVGFEGRGDADPIASNATVEGRTRNRRVEFQIPAEDPAP